MRICALADLHGRLPRNVPSCDVLLLCGDVAPDFVYGNPILAEMYQMEWFGGPFAAWEETVPADTILMSPGNHDWVRSLPDHCRTTMFVDSGCTIDGKTFWFYPWTSEIGKWNYQLRRSLREERCELIPEGLDVLVSHGPAYGCMDVSSFNNENAGCRALRDRLHVVRPRHVFFGHIHEGAKDHGPDMMFGTGTQMHHSTWFGDVPRIFEI